MTISRGIVITALVALFLLSIAHAASDIKIDPVTDHIVFSEKAVFKVTIKNQNDIAQVYELFSLTSGIEWNFQAKPLRNKKLTVAAGQSATTEVTVEPVEKFPPGVYLVSLNVQSDKGEKYDLPMKIYMGPILPKDYSPSIRPVIDIPEQVDPREPQSVRIFIENLNPRDLMGMVIKVVSDIPELKRELTADLEPDGEKTLDFTFKLPDIQQPKKYTIFFQFEYDGEIIKIVDKSIDVVPLVLPFLQSIEEQESFLKTERTLTFTNPGNVRNTQLMATESGLLKSVFTSTSPKAKLTKKDGKRFLAWETELGPGEKATASLSVSYRPPFVIFIILIFAAVLYMIYRNPLIINKSASNIVMQEGGVSALKVIIVAKNLGNTVLKDIELVDEVPSIAAVEKDVEVGTLRPTQILRGKHGGIFVKWKLSELEGKEERHISYKIRSRLNIIGTLELPRAKATFLAAPGKKKVSYSNTFRVNTGE